MSHTFVMMIRDSDASDYLDSRPLESHVLRIVAKRARRTDCQYTGLKAGQARMGDFEKMGMTRQQYRRVISNLEKWGFITIIPTTKGTLVSLCNSESYDINIEEANHQTNQRTNHQTSHRPTNRPTTNNNVNKDKNVNKGKAGGDQDKLDRAFEYFYSGYPKKTKKPDAKKKLSALIKGKDQEFIDSLLDKLSSNIQQRLDSGQWDLTNKQFITNPATYLTNKMWEDEIFEVNDGSYQRSNGQSASAIDDASTDWFDEFERRQQAGNNGFGQPIVPRSESDPSSMAAGPVIEGDSRRVEDAMDDGIHGRGDFRRFTNC